MSMFDRSWMYKRKDNRGHLHTEYKQRVDDFLNFAFANGMIFDDDKIKCPCRDCRNILLKTRDEVKYDLFRRGFVVGYNQWVFHGEPYEFWSNIHGGESSSMGGHQHIVNPNNDQSNPMRDMVHDLRHGDMEWDSDARNEGGHEQGFCHDEASEFFSLLQDADEPLWDGCTTHTKLSAVAELLTCKSDMNMSESHYNRLLAVFISMLPENHSLTKDFYAAKKIMKRFSLGYVSIDVCKNDCTLYYGEDEGLMCCNVCGLPRFKPMNSCLRNEKPKPFKVLRYLPIIPRLQRLFMSAKMSESMTWHSSFNPEPGTMSHPSHGEAWKYFDQIHPDFAFDARNVRLSLCTDGFTPFSSSAKPYSCWPVLITVLNLPPWMAMKHSYTILAAVIPGRKSPGKDLDLFLRPLIDDLKLLWEVGVKTYDVARCETFQMRAALMSTVSDFPAYAMLSGWSTKGNLACPCCMNETKAFRLEKGRKPTWFDSHRKFLPLRHPYRNRRNTFIKGKAVPRLARPLLNGVEVWDQFVSGLPEYVHGKQSNNPMPGYGDSHHFFKRSIFWELPYWKTNLIRHNLDVMHIEKNVFDNIFYTIMDMHGKTKDNLQSRQDMAVLCDRPELNLMSYANGRVVKPKASYALTKEQKHQIFEWINKLKFPDGYASNIGNCFDIKTGHIYGMKSHDCHVFMERLLPIALRDMVPEVVWDAITELSTFFKDLCSPTLRVEHMQVLQTNIVLIMCKLEQIFPPALFDSMEHLLIHLPYEALVGGPAQYRWMFPYERELGDLKDKVKNKAAVEASICEAYIVQEIATFCSIYFKSNVATNLNRVSRNDDGGEVNDYDGPRIFRRPGRPLRRSKASRFMVGTEHSEISLYVLINCDLVEPILQ